MSWRQRKHWRRLRVAKLKTTLRARTFPIIFACVRKMKSNDGMERDTGWNRMILPHRTTLVLIIIDDKSVFYFKIGLLLVTFVQIKVAAFILDPYSLSVTFMDAFQLWLCRFKIQFKILSRRHSSFCLISLRGTMASQQFGQKSSCAQFSQQLHKWPLYCLSAANIVCLNARRSWLIPIVGSSAFRLVIVGSACLIALIPALKSNLSSSYPFLANL